MAHHTLQSLDGASPGIGGLHLPGGETEYEDTCPEYDVNHKDEFWEWIHQDKTCLSWDTTNNGTFSKCKIQILSTLSVCSMMYISLYKLLDP